MYKVIGICLCIFLGSCTTDSVPEEEFEGPTSNFPLLGTVPDRPTLPQTREFVSQQKNLQREHDQATQKKADILAYSNN